MSRKYSIDEIDRMRRALEWSYPSGVSYYPAERVAEVEARLRTYMANGTDPEELEERAQHLLRQEQEVLEKMRAHNAHPGGNG